MNTKQIILNNNCNKNTNLRSKLKTQLRPFSEMFFILYARICRKEVLKCEKNF